MFVINLGRLPPKRKRDRKRALLRLHACGLRTQIAHGANGAPGCPARASAHPQISMAIAGPARLSRVSCPGDSPRVPSVMAHWHGEPSSPTSELAAAPATAG